MDETDLAIVGHLQVDGRRSFRSIADALGLSEGAVRQRATRLREQKVMHVSAIVDPTALGLRLVANLLVQVSGDADAIAETLAHVPEVEYIVITLGSFDLLLEVVCEDTDHLLEIVNGTIRQTAGVVGVQTLVQARVHKQVFEWGSRRKGFSPPNAP